MVYKIRRVGLSAMRVIDEIGKDSDDPRTTGIATAVDGGLCTLYKRARLRPADTRGPADGARRTRRQALRNERRDGHRQGIARELHHAHGGVREQRTRHRADRRRVNGLADLTGGQRRRPEVLITYDSHA